MEDLTSLRLARSTTAASFMVEFFEVIVRVFGTQPNVLSGPLAQLVEQLTLNQRVPGSSPGRLTNPFAYNTASRGRLVLVARGNNCLIGTDLR
jgi:hypothetical protein